MVRQKIVCAAMFSTNAVETSYRKMFQQWNPIQRHNMYLSDTDDEPGDECGGQASVGGDGSEDGTDNMKEGRDEPELLRSVPIGQPPRWQQRQQGAPESSCEEPRLIVRAPHQSALPNTQHTPSITGAE